MDIITGRLDALCTRNPHSNLFAVEGIVLASLFLRLFFTVLSGTSTSRGGTTGTASLSDLILPTVAFFSLSLFLPLSPIHPVTPVGPLAAVALASSQDWISVDYCKDLDSPFTHPEPASLGCSRLPC